MRVVLSMPSAVIRLLAVPPPPPAPEAPPATVYVKSSDSSMRHSYRLIVGEVVNNTDAEVCNVNVLARYYDAANQLIAVEDGLTSLAKTYVGQTNPFRIYLSNAPTAYDRHELQVLWNHCRYHMDYRPVTLLSQFVRDNDGVEVFGELRNDLTAPMRAIRVAVTFYDIHYTVIAMETGYTSTPDDLAPGATTTYQVRTFMQIDYASYLVQPQGYLVP